MPNGFDVDEDPELVQVMHRSQAHTYTMRMLAVIHVRTAGACSFPTGESLRFKTFGTWRTVRDPLYGESLPEGREGERA